MQWLPRDAADTVGLDTWVQSLGPVLLNAYLLESIKAFLIARDYASALQLLNAVEADPLFGDRVLRHLAHEAHARVLMNLGEYDDALHRTATLLEEIATDDIDRLSLYLLVSDIQGRAGGAALCCQTLETLECEWIALVATGGASFRLARIAYGAALRWYELHCPDRAWTVLHRGLVGLQQSGDEVSCLLAQALLCNIAHLLHPIADPALEHRAETTLTDLRRPAHATDYTVERAVCLLHLSRLGDRSERTMLARESLALFEQAAIADRPWWVDRIVREFPDRDSFA